MLRIVSHLHDLKNKKVLVRIDSDVCIENGRILDDTRLDSSLETIRHIQSSGGIVILLGHSGRPDGKAVSRFTLEPVAKWYAQKLQGKIEPVRLREFSGWKISDNLFLLENLRFYKGEEENDPEFTKQIASLGNMYVNEAFAVSHRNHASITGLAKLLPSYAGLHLQKEIEALSKILKNPERPLVVLIGGAKIETKLPIVEKMHHVADYVLVGGKIAEETRALIKVQHEKITGKKSVVLIADNIPAGDDITLKDTENFIQIIGLAKTIVWNGPMGKMGNPKTEENTIKIARAVVNSHAYSVIGGGDSLALLKQHNLLDKFSFVSTGGGAMLEFLSGKELPGIKILES
ncbi:MAG: phosphoglycerate kinase [Candidatus Levyibacteriota bacterium]